MPKTKPETNDQNPQGRHAAMGLSQDGPVGEAVPGSPAPEDDYLAIALAELEDDAPAPASADPGAAPDPLEAPDDRPQEDEGPSLAGQPKPYYVPSATYGGVGANRVDYMTNDPAEQERKANKTPLIVAAVVMACILVGGLVFWLNRPVSIKVNGNEVSEARGASLSQVISDHKVEVKAGNLVSVNGDVLQEGQGQAFSAKVNDADLDQAGIDSYKVAEGDSIEFGTGADVTEDYDATTTEVQPKLRMEGGYGALAYISQWGKVGKVETRTGKVSGQTAEVSVQDVQDCIITLHMPTPDNGQKLVALTFDDGPSEYTQRYLDILAQYHAKATFFELGQNVREYPDLSKAVLAAGCQVASHSDSHPQLTTLDAAALQGELTASFNAIKDVTGTQTTVIRPPYGDFREHNWLYTQGLMSVSVLWTHDSEDWRLPGPQAIAASSTANIAPGSIILMHDGGGNRDQDLEALPLILKTLQDQGYTFVTIDELMASDSSIPQEIASGNATMPTDAVWPTEMGDA